MSEEIAALERNNTWTLVNKPKTEPVISCKWVYKIKRDHSGNILKYKSRLVARGFTQKYGVNYFDTYAPVVRNSTVRMLMALAVENDYYIDQIDVKNAYINSDLHETIYMKQPEGFNKGTDLVCKLNKSLYGLKQSGYEWNRLFNNMLVSSLKFKRSKCDPCVYVKGSDNNKIILAVYVDDVLIFGSNRNNIDSVKKCIAEKFDIVDLGKCSKVLGLNVKSNSGEIIISQKLYAEEVLKKCGMSECNTAPTPMDSGQKLEGCVSEPCSDCGKVNPSDYRAIIGSLMFLAVSTRPDISYAVSALSRFNNKPHLIHFTAAKRVLRYIKGTITCGIRYVKTGNPIYGYVDADWGNDAGDRKSYTGYVFMMAGGPISWESKKQPTVALSSTESEYMAATQGAKEVVFIRNLLQELDQHNSDDPTTLYCDNFGAGELSRNIGYHSRSKHIDLRHHFIRELVENETIVVKHIGTTEMLADILTKALAKTKHVYINNKLLHMS